MTPPEPTEICSCDLSLSLAAHRCLAHDSTPPEPADWQPDPRTLEWAAMQAEAKSAGLAAESRLTRQLAADHWDSVARSIRYIAADLAATLPTDEPERMGP